MQIFKGILNHLKEIKPKEKYPKISIVTPNYNYGHLLEETILSVLNQNYPNLEYIIIDGGSTDNSLEVIKKYESRLAYWTSEKDEGIYDALNKGFKLCTGEIMAYLNSDDIYLPWALETVFSVFSEVRDAEWISTLQPGYIDYVSRARWFGQIPGFSKDAFLNGKYSGRFSKFRFIQQESTFWRKSLWDKTKGSIDINYKLAGDFWIWNEFYKHTELYGILNPISLFRVNSGQKSSDINQYILECEMILNSKIRRKKAIIANKLQILSTAKKYSGSTITRENIGNKNATWCLKEMSFTL